MDLHPRSSSVAVLGFFELCFSRRIAAAAAALASTACLDFSGVVVPVDRGDDALEVFREESCEVFAGDDGALTPSSSATAAAMAFAFSRSVAAAAFLCALAVSAASLAACASARTPAWPGYARST